MHVTRPLFFFGCFTVVACGSTPPPTAPGNPSASPPGASAVPAASEKSAAGAPAGESAACGEASVTLADHCPQKAVDGAACFVDAATACRSAEYLQSTQTDEGGTVVSRYLVEPTEGGCRVVIDTDWSRDPFGPAPRTRTECRSAELALATSGCKVLRTIDCSEDEPTP